MNYATANIEDLVTEARSLAAHDEYPPMTELLVRLADECSKLGALVSVLDQIRSVAGNARGKLALVRLILSDPKSAMEKVKALEPGNTADDAMMIDLMNIVTNSAAKIRTNRMLMRELRTLRGQASVIVTDDDGEAD